MQRKKVLFLITKSNWGGAQRYVYDLATHLDPNLFEPVVACGGTGPLLDMLHNAGIRTITLNTLERDVSFKKDIAFAKELWQTLKAEAPDVLHVNSSKAGAVGTIIGRLARVPRVIFTAHGWAFNEARPWWQKYAIKTIHYFTVLASHKTIAVSSAIVRELHLPGIASKMRIIHPGRNIGPMYDQAEAREKIIDFFPRLRPYHTDPWLVCIAELHPIKQHHILITALAEVRQTYPTVRLVCIGEGQERAHLEAQITALELQEHVFLTGALTEAARFFKAFDIATLASRSEAYGYVLAEAGLALVPVVATKVGGIPDIVTHNESGLLVSTDNPSTIAHSLAMGFIQLLAHPDTAKRLATTLHTKVKSRTVQKMVRDTVIWY